MPKTLDLERIEIRTQWGLQALFRTERYGRPAYVLFRHGVPHHLLPHQINYRAQAQALEQVNCGALLVTSSVGVLDAALPVFKPMLLTDLMMPDNRLPDGSACTMFHERSPDHGHLVVTGGLFSRALNRQIREFGAGMLHGVEQDVVFAYSGGPRTKTPSENRMWRTLGAQVNSMTLAPEVILANELEIPCAGLVVGHKHSVPDIDIPEDKTAMTATLQASKDAMLAVILRFLEKAQAVSFKNQLYLYHH
jgi:purine nucleoside phosphorylase